MIPLVLGAWGMAGRAIVRALSSRGHEEILNPTREQLDLLDQRAVDDYFATHSFDTVILAAARVGGIYAHLKAPADFLYENLTIASQVIHSAHRAGIDRLLFLGSTCIYPTNAPIPIKETSLLTGPLEPSNAPYALAKIAGIKLCQSYREQYGRDYISAMPTNLYGPGDNYDPTRSHVLAALLRRFCEAADSGAPRVEVRGSGRAMREFLHVDDLADACCFLLDHYHDPEPINVGSDDELTIAELAQLIARLAGFEGEVVYNSSYADGVMRKKSDTSRLNALGWRAKTPLQEGIAGEILNTRQALAH